MDYASIKKDYNDGLVHPTYCYRYLDSTTSPKNKKEHLLRYKSELPEEDKNMLKSRVDVGSAGPLKWQFYVLSSGHDNNLWALWWKEDEYNKKTTFELKKALLAKWATVVVVDGYGANKWVDGYEMKKKATNYLSQLGMAEYACSRTAFLESHYDAGNVSVDSPPFAAVNPSDHASKRYASDLFPKVQVWNHSGGVLPVLGTKAWNPNQKELNLAQSAIIIEWANLNNPVGLGKAKNPAALVSMFVDSLVKKRQFDVGRSAMASVGMHLPSMV